MRIPGGIPWDTGDAMEECSSAAEAGQVEVVLTRREYLVFKEMADVLNVQVGVFISDAVAEYSNKKARLIANDVQVELTWEEQASLEHFANTLDMSLSDLTIFMINKRYK